MELSVQEQLEIIKRGVAEIISEEELVRKLERAKKEGRPLRVKLGLDPTAPDIHLGTAVVLRKLRQFQDLGHEAIIVIGDFTAMIGDPSGRSKTRPQLSEEEVKRNAKTYQEQYSKILDPEKTRVVFNSQWLGKTSFADLIRLASKVTVARVLERDDFQNRLKNNIPIGMHEILYPLCQAYDSVVLEADIEMGGTDQKFNNLMGRDLQRAFGQEPQVVILMPLLVGLDGKEKMSKSLGNYVGIEEPPFEMFGKIMSLPDELMIDYFILTTDVPMEEIREIERGLKEGTLHPKEVKKRLAREIVSMYHSPEEARRAEEEFERVFARKELPSEMPEMSIPPSEMRDGKVWVVKLLVMAGIARSNREARTLISQGAMFLNGRRITDPNLDIPVEDGAVLKVGRRFVRLRVSQG
ncbi:tyrosine--tRNA ligase [Candidatus Poribacteria bacterium]|nr:MAG: tyrosine--tRNA ligase [Candidatus Poribacteria bacterium]